MKSVDKDKLFDFLREMEFNRLLSQAISFYGESSNLKFNQSNQDKKKMIINIKNMNVFR